MRRAQTWLGTPQWIAEVRSDLPADAFYGAVAVLAGCAGAAALVRLLSLARGIAPARWPLLLCLAMAAALAAWRIPLDGPVAAAWCTAIGLAVVIFADVGRATVLRVRAAD